MIVHSPLFTYIGTNFEVMGTPPEAQCSALEERYEPAKYDNEGYK